MSKVQWAAVRSGDDIAQSLIPIPGLRPELRGAGGRLIRASNIDEKLEDALDAIRRRPWLTALIRDVRAGKKTSVVSISLGALVVTTALGTGIELGIRHGQDLAELASILKKLSRGRKRRRR